MKQSYESQKKRNAIIAALVAGATLLTGSIGIATHANKNKKPVVDETTTEITTNAEDVNLYLSADFDINNADQVKKRAEEIYAISDKSVTVNEIINLIYYFNGAYDKLTFAKNATDEDKFEAIQEYSIKLHKLLSCNVKDDTAKLTDEEAVVLEDKEIYAYMFMDGKTDPEAKALAKKLANEVDKQLVDIKNNNSLNYESNADNYYAIVKEVKGSKNLKDGSMVLLIIDSKTKAPLYGKYLTEEELKEINKNDQNNYLNTIGFEAAKKNDAYKEAAGAEQKTTTPITEKYKEEDKKDADKKVPSTTQKLKEPVKVDNGGVKLPSIKIEIPTKKPTTTRVETSTFIEKPEASTGSWTEVITGGEVVSESYVDADKELAEKLEQEATIPEEDVTQVYIDEESTYVIDQGGVPVK